MSYSLRNFHSWVNCPFKLLFLRVNCCNNWVVAHKGKWINDDIDFFRLMNYVHRMCIMIPIKISGKTSMMFHSDRQTSAGTDVCTFCRWSPKNTIIKNNWLQVEYKHSKGEINMSYPKINMKDEVYLNTISCFFFKSSNVNFVTIYLLFFILFNRDALIWLVLYRTHRGLSQLLASAVWIYFRACVKVRSQ